MHPFMEGDIVPVAFRYLFLQLKLAVLSILGGGSAMLSVSPNRNEWFLSKTEKRTSGEIYSKL